MDEEDTGARIRSGLGRQIADAIVRITRETTGRGPERAHAVLQGDVVVVLLHDVLTKGEQALVDGGYTAEVLALRSAYQSLMRPAYIAEIERLTDREVATFMSTNHADPDDSAEVFLLRPR